MVKPPSTRPTRVLIRATYPAVRAGLAALLREQGCEVIDDVAGDPFGAQVLLVDLAGGNHPEAAAEGALPVVALVDRGDATRRNFARSGGWISRDADGPTLAAAVGAAAAGLVVFDPSLAPPAREVAPTDEHDDPHLTTREVEVLSHLAAGMTNKAVAQSLAISEHTAKSHVGAVLAKLGARSRTEAVTAAARRGLLTL